MRLTVVLGIALMACGGAPGAREQTGPVAEPSVADGDQPPLIRAAPEAGQGASISQEPVGELDPDWWLERQCPAGAGFVGNGPPDGRKAWCENSAGTKHGPYAMWFADGEKGLEGVYHNGVLHGPWVRWFPGGQVEQRGAYRNGKPDGSWERYHDNGQLASEGSYRGGLEQGTWIYWEADGTQLRVEQWNRGELVQGGD